MSRFTTVSTLVASQNRDIKDNIVLFIVFLGYCTYLFFYCSLYKQLIPSAILYLVLESIILLRIIVKIPLIETNFQTKTLKVRQIFLLYNGLIPFWRSILMFMVSRCLFNICSNLFDICRMFQKHLLKCMFLKKKKCSFRKESTLGL